MLETTDPVATLAAKTIPERAAAARDLSKVGTPEVIPLLVAMAREDKSPAVRLGTAGAAADILSRYRRPPGCDDLSLAQRLELLELFKGIDPGVNAGLFSLLSCIGLEQGFQRIAIGLRDPRGGVRVGAGVGLTRLCASAVHNGDDALEAKVVALLGDLRLPPDALAEVATVSACVGYSSARDAIARLDLPGAQGEAAARAIDILDSLHDNRLVGAWMSDGLDAGEVNPTRVKGLHILAIQGDRAARYAPEEGWTTVPAPSHEKVRHMLIRRVGEHQRRRAFQQGLDTWYAAEPDEVLNTAVDAIQGETLDWLAPGAPRADGLSEILGPLLMRTGAGLFVRAVLELRDGHVDPALATLNEAVGAKGAPAEAFYHLGQVLAARGDLEGARDAWAITEKRAKSKKAWYVIAAREALGE